MSKPVTKDSLPENIYKQNVNKQNKTKTYPSENDKIDCQTRVNKNKLSFSKNIKNLFDEELVAIDFNREESSKK